MVPPIASSARKEMAPSAVLATRAADHRRALLAVKRSAESSSVWLATHWLYWRLTRSIRCRPATSAPLLLPNAPDPSQNPYQKPTSSFCGAVYAILRMLAVHKFEPSSRHQSRVLEQQWGAYVRRSEQGPVIAAPAQIIDGNGGRAGHHHAAASIFCAGPGDLGGQYHGPRGYRHRGDGRHPAFGDRHHGDAPDRPPP